MPRHPGAGSYPATCAAGPWRSGLAATRRTSPWHLWRTSSSRPDDRASTAGSTGAGSRTGTSARSGPRPSRPARARGSAGTPPPQRRISNRPQTSPAAMTNKTNREDARLEPMREHTPEAPRGTTRRSQPPRASAASSSGAKRHRHHQAPARTEAQAEQHAPSWGNPQPAGGHLLRASLVPLLPATARSRCPRLNAQRRCSRPPAAAGAHPPRAPRRRKRNHAPSPRCGARRPGRTPRGSR